MSERREPDRTTHEDASDSARSVTPVTPEKQDEDSFEQIAIVELSLEKSRARAQRAAQALREIHADQHLVEALEQVQEELSTASRRLRQGTYFAVRDAQTRIEAA